MNTIHNIIFDFGGVLLDWNPRYLYESYFNNNAEMEHFLTDICSAEWNTQQDGGRPFAEAVKLLKSQYPEYSEAIELYDSQWEKMLKRDFPESVELLRELKEDGYKIYGLTNWSAEKIGYAFARYDFFNLFDGIIVSGKEHLLKPDKRIYQLLLNRYNLNAKESVFIDDNAANLTPASAMGIKTILFTNISDVRNKLDQLL